MYHLVCPVKYRRIVFDTEKIDNELREICVEISKRYEIDFIENPAYFENLLAKIFEN